MRTAKAIVGTLAAVVAGVAALPVSAQKQTWQAIFSIPVTNTLNVPGKRIIDDLNASCKG